MCNKYFIAVMYFRTFKSMEDLSADYESGELHPGDLKPALAKALNQILQVLPN